MRKTGKKLLTAALGVLLCALLAFTALAAEAEEPVVIEISAPDWSGDALFDAYLNKLFYGSDGLEAKSPLSLEQTLGPTNYALEQRFKALIEEVACGQRTSTELTVSCSDLDMSSYFDPNNSNAAREQINALYRALLADCTSSLYWHDGRLGIGCSFGSSSFTIYFCVAADYAPESLLPSLTEPGIYEVDPDKITDALAAKANADAIIAAYADATDENKLRGYMYEICLRNVYNDEAVYNGSNPSYGTNAWQLVYVFDNKTDTNVVCEGYSKAFEYLCNNTDFDSSLINCCCVSGLAYSDNPNSGHMWNVIRMDDGNNYVVDVTWSDSDDSWQTNYAMFLSYALSGSPSAGYTLSYTPNGYNGSVGVRTYRSFMSVSYTAAELTIHNHAYVGPHTCTAGAPVQENVIPATCIGSGSYDEVVYCSVCGEEMSRTGRTIEPLGHDDGDPAVENVVDPTCTEPGHHEAVLYCGRCGTELSRTEVADDPLGHAEGEPVEEPGVAPTCTEPGYHYTVTYCTRCGEEQHRDTVEDPAAGHSPAEPVAENEIPADFLCDGSHDEVVYCAACGDELSRESAVEPWLKQPKNQYGANGKKASFTLTAAGDDLHYQWYCLKKGATKWTKVKGATSPTLSITAKTDMNGYKYHCVITRGEDSFTTKDVKLTIVTKPKITTQPTNKTVASGKSVAFKVKASGGGLSYQWYYQKKGTASWVKITENGTSATLKLTAKKSLNGYKYRCKIKNAAGSVTSQAVKLTVK